MFETTTLETVIRASGVLSNRPPTATGWYDVKCAVCQDYKPRAAFKFEPNGAVVYHCFNCGHTAGFAPPRTTFSNRMITVIVGFGIDLDYAKRVLFSGFVSDTDSSTLKIADGSGVSVAAPPIEFPSAFIPITSDHTVAYDYLVSRGVASVGEWFINSDPANRRWGNRVIVPVRNNRNQIVFYQGRSFNQNNYNKRWESPSVPKTCVIFNHTLIYNHDTSVPLVVCEGIFDALSVGGVAILGSTFSDYQINELKKYRGAVIIIPNKDKNGKQMALQALQQGYQLSFPDIGSCTDLNEAHVRYGQLYLNQQIQTSTATGSMAEMRLGVWCNQ